MDNVDFDLYEKYQLEFSDLYFLFAAKQVKKDRLERMPQDVYSRLEATSLISSIKGAAKENPLHKVRITTKGKKLFTEPVAGEEEDKLFKWLSNYYTGKGKEIGNPNRVKKLLLWFKQETSIEKNNLVKLFVHFLNDSYVDEASNVLEFTLFYPKKFTVDRGKTIAYEAKPDIHDSWLYKHYLKFKQELDNTFEIY
jgi:uncharacterized protein YneR